MKKALLYSLLLHIVIAILVFTHIKKTPSPTKDEGMISLDLAQLQDKTQAPQLGKPKVSTIKPPEPVKKKTPEKPPTPKKKIIKKKDVKKKELKKEAVSKKKDTSLKKPDLLPKKKHPEPKKTEKKKTPPEKTNKIKEPPKKAFKDLKKDKNKKSSSPPSPTDAFEKLIQEKSKNTPNTPIGHNTSTLGPTVTTSEIAALKERISQCLIYQPGIKDGENIIVKIDMTLTPDARVIKADVVDKKRLKEDPYFRSVAESALRAVRDPNCQPFPLPRHKYKTWKRIILSFNPKMIH
jgi:hypothetical protein